MAVLGVTLGADGSLACTDGTPPGAALARLLPALPPGAPVVILVHGWRFDPARPRHDPHLLLYAPVPARDPARFASWPRGLGFSAEDPADGLCIGLAWPARAPHLPALLRSGRSGFAEVHARAAAAGAALARLAGLVAALRPGRKVDVLAHSLGARVALAALPPLAPWAAPALGRMILLGPAEHAGRAEAALAAAPPGARPEIYAVSARQNALYDALFEAFAPGGAGADAVLARRAPRIRDWIALSLDDPRLLGLARLRGIALGAGAPVCHRGFYLRPGALALWGAMLREREIWSPAALRDHGIGTGGPAPGRRLPPALRLPRPPAALSWRRRA